MFSVVRLFVCLSVCLSRFNPLTVWTLDTTCAFLANQIKIGRSSTTTDKTSLLQTKTHDISFDKSLPLQCGGIHGHYVPLVLYDRSAVWREFSAKMVLEKETVC